MSAMSPRPSLWRRIRAWCAGVWLVGLAAAAGPALAQSVGQPGFDHLKTGFALSGKHAQLRCESCHQNGIFKGTPRDCAACHVAGMRFARGNVVMPQQHVPTLATCDSCHTTRTFIGAKFNHASAVPGTCTSCHGAGKATGKSAQHMPTHAGQSCDDCHKTFSAWRPTAWNHTQVVVAAQCATCHSGGYPPADGRPANHVPYASIAAASSANCDACHKGSVSSWASGRFHTNFSVASGCASCHSGGFMGAVAKPANVTHAAVTGNCESCHKSTTTWAGAKVDHGTFTAATNCASCHGVSATGKPANHIPVGATNCLACHNVSPALWTPTRWNHTQVVVTAACASCHSGGYPPADGRPANHIPYQTVAVTAAANCDSCHKGSTTNWANGRLHAYYALSTGCATCHSGAYLMAVGKPNTATHSTVTGNCESCHKSATSWLTVTFSHSPANAVGTGTCDTCHNGTTAKGKPATHIPIPAGTAKCDSCHKSQVNFASSVTMNHTVVATAQCKSCHNGAYVSQGTQGALAKPTNHIPEIQLLNGAAMDCNACHRSTTSWGTSTMNHNGSLGNGAGWCKACHQSGTSYLGGMEKKSLTHERSTGVTDCSQSGCHRPLGVRGTPYSSW